MKAYSTEIKKNVILRYKNGESVVAISKSTGISRTTIYGWIKNDPSIKNKIINMGNYQKLKSHYQKLERIIEIFKMSPCLVSAPPSERYEVIQNLSEKYSVSSLCGALNVSKGSYCNHILRNKNENTTYAAKREELTAVIKEIYFESKQRYGSGKVHAVLIERGYHTSKETVSKIMHSNGWFSIRSSSKTIYYQYQKKKENIVNRKFKFSKPNEVWVSDVMYFKYKSYNYYICVIIDLYARKVIGCRIAKKNSTQLEKSTFKEAYLSRSPKNLIFHGDQGSNYTSNSFMLYLQQLDIVQSFSQKGNSYNNSVVESFFKNMKTEELYRTNYKSVRELYKAIFDYVKFYNSERPYSMLNYKTPDQWEKLYFQKIEK